MFTAMKTQLIHLTVIFITLDISSGYNFEIDKMLLNNHFDNTKGIDSFKITLENSDLSRSKKRHSKVVQFKPSKTNYFQGGGFNPEDSKNLYEPESSFFETFFERKKRNVFDTPIDIDIMSDRKQNKIKRRSLFGELIEIPRSKNITFVKPGKVKLFAIEPYNAIVLQPKTLEKINSDAFTKKKMANLITEQTSRDLVTTNNSNHIHNDNNVISINKPFSYDAEVDGGYHSNKVIPISTVAQNKQNVNNISDSEATLTSQAMDDEFDWGNKSVKTKEYIDRNNVELKKHLVTQINTPQNYTSSVVNTTTVVSEVALLKVLAILTKTLRKIMRHHEEMKKMHREVIFASKDLMDKRDNIMGKMKNFDRKQNYLTKHGNSLAALQYTLASKQEEFIKKENIFMKKHKEFEQLQLQFSAQQQQFFKLQQKVANNNIKIQMKQGQMTKKLQEISEKQNMLWSILHKTKSFLEDKSFAESNDSPLARSELNISLESNSSKSSENDRKIVQFDTPLTNLRTVNFARSQICNDKVILNEKDESDIDDLVYKHYFKNTTMDRLINGLKKTHKCTNGKCACSGSKTTNKGFEINDEQVTIMKTKRVTADHNSSVEKTENKTNDSDKSKDINTQDLNSTLLKKYQNTEVINTNKYKGMDNSQTRLEILLPSSKRHKRSVRHKNRKLKGGKLMSHNHFNDLNKNNNVQKVRVTNTGSDLNKTTDLEHQQQVNETTTKAYISAERLEKIKAYCNEIGQNSNEDIRSWCIDKAIRKATDRTVKEILALKITQSKMTKAVTSVTTPKYIHKTTQKTTPQTYVSTSPMTSSTKATTKSPYFPDNDVLEANAEDYEPPTSNTDGAVYYDGSFHGSDSPIQAQPQASRGSTAAKLKRDIRRDVPENEGGASDLMPGDNSEDVMEPHDQHSDYIRRMNRKS